MLFENTIVGPVQSRRLGTSLGINLLPLHRKVCDFDCVYCECGWNRESEANEILMPDVSQIAGLLEKRLTELLEQGVRIDSLTFSGNGEPTASPHFPQVVDMGIEMRNRYFPDAKVSLLSNSTRLGKVRVFEAICKIDNPILKLDAGTPGMWNLINRPTKDCCSFDEVVEKLTELGNRCIIQTLLFRGESEGKEISNISESEFESYLCLLEKIRPKSVMIYALDRATPEKNLVKLTADELKVYSQKLESQGIETKVYG